MTPQQLTVYRIHIRPKGGVGNVRRSFNYCREQGVLGLGWPLHGAFGMEISWAEYEKRAVAIYGKAQLSNVVRLHMAQAGDLLWTRDPDGQYFVGRVLQPWRYDGSDAARDADIVNVLGCRIEPVPQPDDVPGAVINSFRASKALQRVTDATARTYSFLLWNQLAGSNEYEIPIADGMDLLSILDDEDAENLLFIYLQMQGWIVLPASRRHDTMRYEYTLICPRDGRRAVAQVKTGDVPLAPSEWSGKYDRVFLFQTRGRYPGPRANNVECLEPAQLISFAQEHRHLMPWTILHRLEAFERLSSRA